MSSKWISRHGFVLPNSHQDQSENGVLFSVEYAFLRAKFLNEPSMFDLPDLIRSLWETNGGSYRTLPNDDNPRFSLDNMKAVAAFSRRYINEAPENRENLNKLSFFRKYSLRPDSFIFLLYCRYPLIGFWFLWVVSITMIYTCFKDESESSGKNLAFVQYMGANMNLTWWLCEKILKDPVIPWETYFPEIDHPINIQAREIWR